MVKGIDDKMNAILFTALKSDVDDYNKEEAKLCVDDRDIRVISDISSNTYKDNLLNAYVLGVNLIAVISKTRLINVEGTFFAEKMGTRLTYINFVVKEYLQELLGKLSLPEDSRESLKVYKKVKFSDIVENDVLDYEGIKENWNKIIFGYVNENSPDDSVEGIEINTLQKIKEYVDGDING